MFLEIGLITHSRHFGSGTFSLMSIPGFSAMGLAYGCVELMLYVVCYTESGS